MTTIVQTKRLETPERLETYRQLAAWLPLVVLPIAAGWLTATLAAWVQMWVIAIAIYAGFKWATFVLAEAARRASVTKSVGYLFLWTGMDADAFFGARKQADKPRWGEVAWTAAQAAFGVWLLFKVAPRFAASRPLVAGWLTMTGIVSILHFGLSHFLSLAWRTAGVNARHIMDKPALARSLADFWGRRWNLAFRDLMHTDVFQPLAPQIGVAWATLAVFLVSGLIHDAVISYAAGAGFGLPTLYFLIQGLAVRVEHSRAGKRAGLGRGFVGRLFAVVVIVAPAGLLFHPPFMTRVVLPMLAAIQGVLS
jgi:alginate O-acetyltransferase complex protein AlgI